MGGGWRVASRGGYANTLLTKIRGYFGVDMNSFLLNKNNVLLTCPFLTFLFNEKKKKKNQMFLFFRIAFTLKHPLIFVSSIVTIEFN